MKIISLSASNVKRLRAIYIEPDGTLQVITGRNAQGKTSVLDAIWLALGGRSASFDTKMPIRDGQHHAHVELDLGGIVVTRSWSDDGKPSQLSVKAADGGKFSSPQAMLDGLIGRISFDPLEFTRLPAAEQAAALLDLLGLTGWLADVDRHRLALYDERTEIGREQKALGEIPALLPAPAKPVDTAKLVLKLRGLREVRQKADAADQAKFDAERQHLTASNMVDQITAELERAVDLRDRRAEEVATAAARLVGMPRATEAAIAKVEDDLAGADEVNGDVRANAAAAVKGKEFIRLRGAFEGHTARIAELDKTKAERLTAADFPVDGLGFSDAGVVTYNGVPFSQASASEQIRVSMAMAMAGEPQLRVMRIMDGSLLDADSMVQIAQMAGEADYQVWVERVQDSSESAVVIEDGSVVS